MNGLVMMLLAVVVLGGAYLIYGRYLAKKWGVDPDAKTPAYEMEDGVDYVPADTNVVFGHQFASIAGAGPINGPIQAAMFGWRILRRGSGLCRHVCFRQEQGTFHWLHNRGLYRQARQKAVPFIHLAVLHPGSGGLC